MLNLRQIVTRTTESLRGLILVEMPDSVHFESWFSDAMDGDQIAGYIGDLVRAQHRVLEGMDSRTGEAGITIETGRYTVIVRDLNPRIAGTFLFDHQTPLGMARYELQRLLKVLVPELPTEQVEQRPRGVRVIEFLRRYAPDPHAVLMRISLRTGIDLDALEVPETLDAAEVDSLETAAKHILGLEQLSI